MNYVSSILTKYIIRNMVTLCGIQSLGFPNYHSTSHVNIDAYRLVPGPVLLVGWRVLREKENVRLELA